MIIVPPRSSCDEDGRWRVQRPARTCPDMSGGRRPRQRHRGNACTVGDLVGWITERRLVILGELAGMVLRWVRAGRPIPARYHLVRALVAASALPAAHHATTAPLAAEVSTHVPA